MEELGIECQVGPPAKIRACEPRKQKHDRRDALLLLTSLSEDRFPSIWMPSLDQRDVRALLTYRHQWVRIGVRVQNALQSIALSHGLRRGRAMWSKAGLAAIRSLPLPPYSTERRDALVRLYLQMREEIDELDKIVAECAAERERARLLVTHPGVGPITALATESILGDPARFADGKAVASYVGLIPSEFSSGDGDRFWVDSRSKAARCCASCGVKPAAPPRKDEQLKRFYRRELAQKGFAKAKCAAGRKLGIRLWIMLRDNISYQEFCRRARQQTDVPCGDA
jgi:transposase